MLYFSVFLGLTATMMARRGSQKVRTGCATCKILKVKCDEKKPFCDRCTNTYRQCDGYEQKTNSFDLFRATLQIKGLCRGANGGRYGQDCLTAGADAPWNRFANP
ncbi:hypothetical protein BX600DRAFT_116313 [Xylariales sp. PMI_506]|nr:hypothetical protein BX600DRAFT_116313 [Xylariales sp. PMI_506]